MLAKEFNDKYRNWSYNKRSIIGFENEKIIKSLDCLFEYLTQIEGFVIYQIKIKWGEFRFYSNLSRRFDAMVEDLLDNINKDSE